MENMYILSALFIRDGSIDHSPYAIMAQSEEEAVEMSASLLEDSMEFTGKKLIHMILLPASVCMLRKYQEKHGLKESDWNLSIRETEVTVPVLELTKHNGNYFFADPSVTAPKATGQLFDVAFIMSSPFCFDVYFSFTFDVSVSISNGIGIGKALDVPGVESFSLHGKNWHAIVNPTYDTESVLTQLAKAIIKHVAH